MLKYSCKNKIQTPSPPNNDKAERGRLNPAAGHSLLSRKRILFMSYKIIITNNKNGEVLVNEENAVAIVGAVVNKQNIAEIGFTDCNALHLANAILGAEAAISEIKNEEPAVDLFLQLKAMEDKTKANNND